MTKQTSAVEEYLEIFVRFTEQKKPIKTVEVAKELNIAPASVSEMFRKLQKKKLVKLTPYKGVELTKRGLFLGKKVLIRHRLIEKFLKVIGVSKRKIHGEACSLEHAVCDEVEDAIAKLMKNKKFLELMNKK